MVFTAITKVEKDLVQDGFLLITFVVNPKYKNVYATVRDHMYIYTSRSYSKVQTTIKKYSGVIVISKVDGDRQVIRDKRIIMRLAG